MFRPTWKWEGGVALVGAESSGKSTLIKHLGAQLFVPCVGEIVRGTLKMMNLDSPPAYGCDFKLTMEFQSMLQRRRVEEERRNKFFIADRSSIDSFAYTLACCGRDPESQEWLKKFYAENIDYAREVYKLFIVVPTGRFPIVPDGIRNPNPFNALMMHSMILGLLVEHNLPHYVLQSVNIECRVKETLTVLQQRGLITQEVNCQCGSGS